MTLAGFDLSDPKNRPSSLNMDEQLVLTQKLLKGEVGDHMKRVSQIAEMNGIGKTNAMANLTKRIQIALKQKGAQDKKKRLTKTLQQRPKGSDGSESMTDSDVSVNLSDYDSESDSN